MTTTQRDAISSPPAGLEIFNTSTSQFNLYDGSAWNIVTSDVTLAAFGSVPNSSGASLSGQALTLQPANASFAGGVSTTTQSFAGDKTFIGNVQVNSSVGFKVTGGGSNIVTLTAPSNSSTYTMKLPTAQGAASTVLTNDGSGNLSFTTPSSGSFIGAICYLDPATTTLTTIPSNATTIVDFDHCTLDPDSAVTTGSSWHYTVPASKGGKFQVAAGLELNVNPAVGWDLTVHVNGTVVNYGLFIGPSASASGRMSSRVFTASAGDTIDVRIFQRNAANSVNDFSGAANQSANYISIVRVGP